MAAAVFSPAPPNNLVSDPFFSPSPHHIISAPIPPPSRPKMLSSSPNKPPKPQQERPSQEAPPSTLHRIRSSLESIRYSTRTSRANAASPTPTANDPSQSRNKIKKSKGTNDVTKDMTSASKKDIDETKEKPNMLRRIEGRVLRRSAVPTSQSLAPPSTEVAKANSNLGKVDEPCTPTNKSFVPPTLRQATMSSPALHMASQAIPSPKSRPAIAASSSSSTDPLISPPRERRASLQPSSRGVNSPVPATPRRPSKEYPRPSSSRPSPLILPSHPSSSRSPHGQSSPETPTKKAQELPSPPDTPTPVARKASLNTTPPQRMASISSNVRTQSNSPTPHPRSPSRTRVVTPTNPHGLTSASTTNLPSTNHERRRGGDSPSPPRVSSPSIRPRAVSPSHGRSRQFNASTTSLCAVPTFEQRELVRNAISILCKEMSKQPPHLSGATGAREWHEVEKRMDGLIRLWGKGGGLANGSSPQLPGVSNKLSPSAEERERKLFSSTLRDGYVLCQCVFSSILILVY
jgi:hypothetical protein